MEKTCKTCKENDCGLCDRTGRLVEDDDQCEKWTGNQTDWRTRMMQAPESSYAVNTRNVVNTTKTLTAHRRKRGEWN